MNFAILGGLLAPLTRTQLQLAPFGSAENVGLAA